jgi:phosphate transport system substrate-binding protein
MDKRSVGLLLVLAFVNFLNPYSTRAQEKLKGRVSISGAFALYAMSVKWAGEFRKIYPEVKIDISAGGAGKGITDVLNGMVDIGMVSRDVYPEEIKKGAVPIAVAKDAVVAVINTRNPILVDVVSQGLTPEAAGNIWLKGAYKNWNEAFHSKTKAPIHVYTRSDACGAAEVWSRFFDGKQEDLLGSAVFGDPGLALAIRKDMLGIGFNNICYAYDFVTRRPFKGIQIVPIDSNRNGKIDADENFYHTLDELIQAISAGKYPSPPARDLYFVIGKKQNNKAASVFLKWVLTDGQKFVNESGCVNLPKERISEELKKIN